MTTLHDMSVAQLAQALQTLKVTLGQRERIRQRLVAVLGVGEHHAGEKRAQ